jgi:hypothetical protein
MTSIGIPVNSFLDKTLAAGSARFILNLTDESKINLI